MINAHGYRADILTSLLRPALGTPVVVWMGPTDPRWSAGDDATTLALVGVMFPLHTLLANGEAPSGAVVCAESTGAKTLSATIAKNRGKIEK